MSEERFGVTSDLRALAAMELPPKQDPLGRNIVKLTIFLVCFTILGALTIVSWALVQAINREKSAKDELSCLRSSTLLVDQALGDGMITLIDNDNIILYALQGAGTQNQAQIQEAVADFETRVTEGESAQKAIEEAMASREEALQRC